MRHSIENASFFIFVNKNILLFLSAWQRDETKNW